MQLTKVTTVFSDILKHLRQIDIWKHTKWVLSTFVSHLQYTTTIYHLQYCKINIFIFITQANFLEVQFEYILN